MVSYKRRSKIVKVKGSEKMGISDLIEQYLKEMFSQDNEIVIKRNDLASQFNCVPSQINYVIKTRFTNENGFTVESRRGGGGYVTIRKKSFSKNDYLARLVSLIDNRLKQSEALLYIKSLYENGFISEREANLICCAISDNSLSEAGDKKDPLRAKILKSIILSLMR